MNKIKIPNNKIYSKENLKKLGEKIDVIKIMVDISQKQKCKSQTIPADITDEIKQKLNEWVTWHMGY